MIRIYHFVSYLAQVCFLLSKYLCCLLLLAITGVIFAEVIFRYLFNAPLMWAESIVKFFLIALSFLGAGMALKLRSHMIISLVWDKFPVKLQRILRTVFEAMIFAFFVLFAILGYKAAMSIGGFLWDLGMLKKKWLFMLLPVSGIIISVQVLYLVLEDIFGPSDESER